MSYFIQIVANMAPIPYFNKVQIISLFQDGLSHSKISERLGIGRSKISAIIKKKMEARSNSGTTSRFRRNQNEQLLNVIRNSSVLTSSSAE
jgi:transposase